MQQSGVVMPQRLLLAIAIFSFAGMAQALAETAEVRLTTVDDRKAVIATVEPVHELFARSRIAGTISTISVKEGDKVEAGDSMAVVVDEKLMLQMKAVEARIEAQEAEYEQARIDYDRASSLRKSGTISQATLDQARTRFNVAERNLRALRSDRQVIEQQSIEGAVLAPGAGRVLDVLLQEGSVVMAGDNVARMATDNYILRLQLPERHAQFLQTGDEILVGARGMAGTDNEVTSKGRVVTVYPRIDQGRVIADVDVEGLGDYFVGERTRVFVATGKREALTVPDGFIYRRFGVTYAKLDSGVEVVVQVGLPVDGGIEVLSGLRPGDVVVKP
ncbi:efflux RND transporter periplasmic adaptor subunit [Parvibaculum sp.]|uniref:efflux RND transporter periplasmic adaptor subunit n=2 Tax=Parvibaculum sp. TaxID=2024848 RepID=UPI001B1A7098|nr:efflux RND transporter periplasmic adaptor subunit [Parvibaculum sp.]MBO6668123.1 efflux RND transporter periplasmic adaptor subunit [Parvibaculum sp.]MBO6692949.1 efflux RND transporter periplasmic adaptor subunit [Parvibaculum sp.]MBO6715561.1 efflux RND transporter periplasmic adaptor subunit [Parvibaculum sp.]|tara:strand:- start:51 stop:1046 length:996 start_codon:yes stop_codon:yes gene_type:complete